ncbi:beta-lactamase-like protein, partial [Cytidiella melzeri]
SLPRDADNQNYVTVKPIIAGKITLPMNLAFQDSHAEPASNAIEAPVFSFLITHPSRGHALFDLGIRKRGEGYPPSLHSRIHDMFKAVSEEDVVDELRKGGVEAEDISTVVLRYVSTFCPFACVFHLHWDHIGDPSLFPNAEIVMGGGVQTKLAERVYPENPRGTIMELPKANKKTFIHFQNTDSTTFKSVSPLATFATAVDFFGDGSVYLVDTPGHCPGHISGLVRIAPDTFVFLGGDLCHHREAYDPGTRLISEKMYEDVDTARDTVERLATLNKKMANVIVVLAHEAHRLEEGMPLFPEDMRDWALEMVRKR